MASYINTNFASLNAQNNLAGSQMKLQTSISRLSSGLRINTAADDAAGLAISDRMTSQINGLQQAGRNANDGISLAQTADGALASVSSSLQRIRQLAVQSANSTNSSSDRASLNQESTQLLNEISRVATTTQFNGLNLLDGSFQGSQFQVGANANQTINVNLSGATTSSLGSYSATASGQVVSATAFTAANALTINGVTVGASASTNPAANGALGLSAGSGFAKAAAINQVTSQTGVTAVATTTVTGGAAPIAAPASAMNAGDLTVNGINVGAVSAGTSVVGQGQNVAAAINAISAQTGVTAAADSSTGILTLTANDGRDITLGSSATTTPAAVLSATGLTANVNSGTLAAPTGGSTTTATMTLTSAANFSLSGATTGLADAGLTGYAETQNALSTVDLTTVKGANSALSIVDAAISQVDSQRAVLGATSNRFQATVSNLSQTAANLSSARSRIQDTDFASETASLSQAQILQQAGTAMLTQANSLPNSVLSLLKG